MTACFASLQTQLLVGLVNGIAIGMIYALIALGLSMVYGILNLINFAHGEVFMVGAFAALGAISGLSALGLPIFVVLAVALVAAALASGIAAMLLEIVAYRPLRRAGAPRYASMISGMGASIFLQEAFALLFARGNIPFPSILPLQTLFFIGSARVTNRMAIIVVATIAMMFALDWCVMKTRLGRGMRALAQDPRAAQLMGVNISAVVLGTFLIGGLCAGVGGFLYGLYFTKTSYILGFIPGLKGLTASILGGVGNLRGAVVGGLLLGIIENVGAICVPSQLKDVIGFGALLLVLIIRPQGLLGERLAASRPA